MSLDMCSCYLGVYFEILLLNIQKINTHFSIMVSMLKSNSGGVYLKDFTRVPRVLCLLVQTGSFQHGKDSGRS